MKVTDTMADNDFDAGGNDGLINSADPMANGAAGPQASLISHYVKDLSVENPNAPEVYQWPSQLGFDVNFKAESRQLNEEVHEVLCTYTVTAKADQGTAYIIELVYGALVGLRGLNEDDTRRFLFAETPRLVFPAVRLLLGQLTRDSGFPPMVLEPIDFIGLYDQQHGSRSAGDGPPVGNA